MGKGGFFDALMECVQAVMCMVFCFFCGGLILLAIGAAFYFKPDTRGPKVRTFNDAVDIWLASGQAEFANATGGFSVVSTGKFTTKLDLNTADDKGNQMHDTNDDWHRWDKYAFYRCPVVGNSRLCSVQYKSTLSYRDFAFSSSNSIQNVLSVQSGSGSGNYSIVNPPGVGLVSTNTLSIPGCSNSSSCSDYLRKLRCESNLQGIYYKSYCYAAYILERVGFVTAKQDGKYVKSTLYDGVFFTRDSVFGGWNGLTPAALYAAGVDNLYPQNSNPTCAKSVSNNGCDIVQVVTLPNVYAEVRSEGDPWVVAVSLTNGAADFGLTKAQEKKIGLVLFVLGIIFYVPACLCACLLCKRREHVSDAYNGTYQPGQYNGNYSNVNSYNPSAYQQQPANGAPYANYGTTPNAAPGYASYGAPQQPAYGNYGAPPPSAPAYSGYGAPPAPAYGGYGQQPPAPSYGGYGQQANPYPAPPQNYQGYAPTK